MMSLLLNWFRPRPRTIRNRAGRKKALIKLHAEVLEDRTVPSAGWAIGVAGTGWTNNYGLAIDTQQNSVITGLFSGATDFDPGAGATTLTSAGGTDVYVAKYTPSGALAWAQRFGGTDQDTGLHVAVDVSGNVYVAGYFSANATFGAIALTSAGGQDAFIAELDSSGNVIWVRQFGGVGDDQAWGIAVDSSGNAYATGYFAGTASFASGPSLTSAGGHDGFIAKLDASSGNVTWVQQLGGSGDDEPMAVTSDPNGNVYVAGRFQSTAGFGATILNSKGGSDAFVTRLDGLGNFQWAQRMGGEGNTINDGAYGIAVDAQAADGSSWAVYLAGTMNGNNCDFGLTTFTTYGTDSPGSTQRDDAFVTKLDATVGSFIWADQLGGAGQELGRAISLDGAGNVYTTGVFGAANQPADFDPGPGAYVLSPGSGFRAGYVSMLDASGNFAGAWQTSGGDHNQGKDIAADPSGNVWVSGQFDVTTTFPTGETLTPAGLSSTFLMRLDAPHGAIQGTVYGDWNNNGVRNSNEPGLSGRTVYVDQNGNGQFDSGERSAATDAQGHYAIDNLVAGTFNVRQVVPAGWTGTTVGGATISVGSGFVQGVDLGQFKAASRHNYTSNKVPQKTSNGKPNAISTLAITDTALIYDLTLTLNLSNTKNLPLTVFLIAPDGTKVTLLSNTVVNGTLTLQTSAFDFKSAKGTWTLEVDGLTGGTLNSWSLSVLEPITP